jgi:hypothetical protein
MRRQGILTAVGSAANRAWAEAGVRFLTGLPLASWGSPRERLGWQALFPFVWLDRTLRPDRRVLRRRSLPALLRAPLRAAARLWNAWWDRRIGTIPPGLVVREVREAGPEFDALWQSVGPAYESLVVRDRAWVAYRYLEAPGFGYRVLLAERNGQPAGYLAFRISPDAALTSAWIADLFAAPGDASAVRVLLRHAVLELRRAGTDYVRVLVAPDTWLAREFRRAGFRQARGSYDVSVVPLDPSQPLDALSGPERWFTMGGDYDVI